ncbi:putative cytosol aminopeptidase [Paraburkholderia unamae]|uniref:leucyl aminopeptidase n=1 Tax=Paraburkholderia unamae TaxID=219649 RepID=UPI001CAD6838|nr:leucyl aminopeptidase [Paraburkholderia unamae]CAG9266284.1 putative cytosol aminopeptidase [Paraburkholderia unamae]
MKFRAKKHANDRSVLNAADDAIVIGLFEDEGRGMSKTGQMADRLTGGQLSRHAAIDGFSGAPGNVLCVREPAGLRTRRLIAVGLGKAASYDRDAWLRAAQSAAKALGPAARSVTWALPAIAAWGDDVSGYALATILALRSVAYATTAYRSPPVPPPVVAAMLEVAVAVRAPHEEAMTQALAYASAVADGVDVARELGNAPGNVCTPAWLGEAAASLAAPGGLDVEVLGPAQLRELKMHALLAVGQGSDAPPCLIVMRHAGGLPDEAPVVLIGKGVTFDAGGISLKPGAAMDEMKFDMCGAAAVIGTMKAVAALGLRMNVVGIVAACENLPDGRAFKPGDVITGMSGKTIEVLNTDAEGRLILSDALTYAQRLKPAAMVDVATLTGAAVVALGHHYSALFANDEPLAAALLASGARSGDAAWRMPLGAPYQEALRSGIADMNNLGGAGAGATTAACFLERFVEGHAWAHLDIAGTAWRSGPEKGATGRPVALLVDFLARRARA